MGTRFYTIIKNLLRSIGLKSSANRTKLERILRNIFKDRLIRCGDIKLSRSLYSRNQYIIEMI